jgi:hypothetical protein
LSKTYFTHFDSKLHFSVLFYVNISAAETFRDSIKRRMRFKKAKIFSLISGDCVQDSENPDTCKTFCRQTGRCASLAANGDVDVDAELFDVGSAAQQAFGFADLEMARRAPGC